MKTTLRTTILAITACSLFGCATVDVTKTAKGYFPPTNPNNVDILMTVPPRQFVELGTVTVQKFQAAEEAKMHNAVRAKAAPLGANAVILQSQGINPNGQRWAIGVAIHYT
jgi:hypothetical protein